MGISFRVWRLLWVVAMLASFAIGSVYISATLPARPGMYWLTPYPADVWTSQRKMETDARYQAAVARWRQQRSVRVLSALTLWIAVGAALYAFGANVQRMRSIREPQP